MGAHNVDIDDELVKKAMFKFLERHGKDLPEQGDKKLMFAEALTEYIATKG